MRNELVFVCLRKNVFCTGALLTGALLTNIPT